MGRSPCCEKAHTNKGAWTKEEDERLISYIGAHSEGCWRSLPKAAGLLRCGKSCRLRWINYLRPDLKRGHFTPEEDELIINLHSLLGNKWSLIAGKSAGRTDNEIKNYWNTHLRRKLLSRGIDPVTHRPLNEPTTTTTSTSNSTTLIFSAVEDKKEGEENYEVIIGCQEQKNTSQEQCPPHLNLELRISLPSHHPPPQLPSKSIGKSLCFSCRLGLFNNKECTCCISRDDLVSLDTGVVEYVNFSQQ
ncbi:hypothetical protein ACSBR1_000202 [Camellia fascicularis]